MVAPFIEITHQSMEQVRVLVLVSAGHRTSNLVTYEKDARWVQQSSIQYIRTLLIAMQHSDTAFFWTNRSVSFVIVSPHVDTDQSESPHHC